ncbi:MAG: hypothetical protein UT97_C0010G0035 [Parcubacteria group bacterium GW2011_GWC2_40_31]|nr:MAG: hypothetical protein UT71_C0009G0001 [Parcubacteria group bacterium GW2011_GWF2_40_10]KKR59824.1 MAG: hypothetical protein UT97_C0010G0035 [Parcubacteria group bacterium GW2011_GWC2_40_31]
MSAELGFVGGAGRIAGGRPGLAGAIKTFVVVISGVRAVAPNFAGRDDVSVGGVFHRDGKVTAGNDGV